MKNENIHPGDLVPEEIRLECYKEALEIVKNFDKQFGLSNPVVCLILPCVLWGLEDYEDDAPNGELWFFYHAPEMFPEIEGIQRAFKFSQNKKQTRIEFLEKAICELNQ